MSEHPHPVIPAKAGSQGKDVASGTVLPWIPAFAGMTMAALLASSAAAQDRWPERLYNPQKADGDLVLPMPCGGAMTFRRIDLPADGALGDRRVQLGGADDKLAYAENTRTDYVAGGFTDPKAKGVRYYWLGKYEVTSRQYDAFAEPCAKPKEEGRLPKVSVTWAEAVGFAARYSNWLVAHAAKDLPVEDGAPAFLRLPTEAEWEYAARGGAAVPDSIFVDQAFPMPEGMARYVWYQGTDSANNELNAIGLLKPNPLGLHDMLGNAGEFVLDPFRLNKLSRLHGQAGGQTVKGGDYRTPAADIRSAARQEFAPVDKKGERRSATTGFRLALVSPSLPSPQRLAQIRTDWAALPTTGTALQDDPVKEVEALAQSVEDPAIKKRIAALSTVIKTSIQTRNEQRDRAAVNALRVGAYVADKLSADKRVIAAQEAALAALGSASADTRKQVEDRLVQNRRALDDNLSYYVDVVLAIAADYPDSVVSGQAEVLKRDLEARKVDVLARQVDPLVKRVEQVRGGRPLDRDAVLKEIR
jgi:hypothetical protein